MIIKRNVLSSVHAVSSRRMIRWIARLTIISRTRKIPSHGEKGIPPYEGERTSERDRTRERLRGKIRKRENLERVLIANMTMLNSPPGGPRARITLELVCLLLHCVRLSTLSRQMKIVQVDFFECGSISLSIARETGLPKRRT